MNLYQDNLRKQLYGNENNMISGKLKEMYDADMAGDGPIHEACKDFAEAGF